MRASLPLEFVYLPEREAKEMLRRENRKVALVFLVYGLIWAIALAGAAWLLHQIYLLITEPAAETLMSNPIVRRGIDTYVLVQVTYTFGGKKIIGYVWRRLPRPGKKPQTR